jgi:hypothetical protein
MSLLSRYKWFKLGIVTRKTNVNMQRFFKTNPTEEQLLLLDEMSKENDNVFIIALFIYFVLGFVAGFMVGLYYVGYI